LGQQVAVPLAVRGFREDDCAPDTSGFDQAS
jgi:hypothetical protein